MDTDRKEEIREKWLRKKALADYYGWPTDEARRDIRKLLTALDDAERQRDEAIAQVFEVAQKNEELHLVRGKCERCSRDLVHCSSCCEEIMAELLNKYGSADGRVKS